jgi:hypothetical protein
MSNTSSLLDRLNNIINSITAFMERHRVTKIIQSDGRTEILFRDITPESKEELGGANILAPEDSDDDGVIEPEDPADGSIEPDNLDDDGAIE